MRDREAVRELVAKALAEDLGEGDVTSQVVVPAEARVRARIVQKQPGTVFGLAVAAEVFDQAGAPDLRALIAEGSAAGEGEAPRDVATVDGPAWAVLGAERTALNFLAHLSGIATLTARYVAAVEGTGARILDTRKTTPGWRELEKAAVAAGGGTNHRMGLHDAILIKENHATIVGGVGKAVERARVRRTTEQIEVECRDLEEVREAVRAGADRLLLDNMTPDELRAAVAAAREAAGACRPPTLEASGGITLSNVREVASSGVRYVSIGALTHSAPALDLSLLLD